MKWLIRIGLTLVTLVVVAAGAIALVPVDQVARVAAERFEAETGRSLRIEGPVRATLWPQVGVRAEGIALANADWAAGRPMLTARALDIGIDPAGLLRGDVAIRSLEAEGAELALERRADGVGNWVLSRPGASSGPAAAGRRSVSVDQAVLRDARISFTDRATQASWVLDAVDLTAELPAMDGPAGLTGSALMNGVALAIEGRIDGVLPMAQGALTPVRLALRSGGTEVLLEGRADLDPASFEGSLQLRSDDRLAILGALGHAPLDLPAGLGRDRIAALADVTLAPEGSLHLRGLDLTLDGNALAGGLDLAPGADRPYVTATLAAPALDLTGLSSGGDGPARDGWGQEAIDVSALFLADGELSFTSGPVSFGDAVLDRVEMGLAVDRGRAVATLQPVAAYGGEITGSVVVNGRGGLSSRAVLDLKGLQMQPFLTAFADHDRIVGVADLSINLLGVGDTMQALVESLEGQASFRIGRGEMLGLDLAGMIRTLDLDYRGEGRKTVFDGASGSFEVAGGVARGMDLTISAPLLAAEGAGEIDLGARTLDYRLMSTLRRSAESEGVTVPILITGAWSDPKVRPDLEWLARRELEARAREEAAKIEARVREEAEEAARRAEQAAREKLAEELNVSADALDSREAIEAAIRDRVGAELLDALRNR